MDVLNEEKIIHQGVVTIHHDPIHAIRKHPNVNASQSQGNAG